MPARETSSVNDTSEPSNNHDGGVLGSYCEDLDGHKVHNGSLYVPGSDKCLVCNCHEGFPKWCQAVMCQPPQDCKTNFRSGNSCCDFKCQDEGYPGGGPGGGLDRNTDFGLRLVASTMTAVLSLALLFFLLHRLRRRRIRVLRNAHMRDEHVHMGSMGYLNGSMGFIAGSVAYLNGRDHVEFLYEPPSPPYMFWKFPHRTYIPPPGEAPPPYSEVVGEFQNRNQTNAGDNAPERPRANCKTVDTQTESPKKEEEDTASFEGILSGRGPASAGREGLVSITSDARYEDIRESCDCPNGAPHTCCPPAHKPHRKHRLLSGAEREAALQRFSLQLELDLSDSQSSSSVTLSPEAEGPTSTDTTSSDMPTHI